MVVGANPKPIFQKLAELAGRMIRIWEEVSGEGRKHVTEDVDSKVFYGEGYEDSDRRVPDITLAREHLEWEPRTTLEHCFQVRLSALPGYSHHNIYPL